MSDFDVGARLKAIREDSGLSQRELAQRAGVTNGLVSLVERNKTSPSITSLRKILEILGMTLAEFFDSGAPADPGRFVFRHDELTEINPGRIYLSAGADALKALSLRRAGKQGQTNLLLLYETYDPGADTGEEAYSHEGEEGGFVIEGELLLSVGDTTEILRAGDAYLFDSRLPHRFRNVTQKRCVVVSAATPPTF
ncbi:cupin domain-containing protein [Thioclava atlantica]|uniref:DNA-binding transcriptional repressor n=1 Tax=Thioclava atlantica TaxID=1317124 RepID=A0A085TUX2_9RHOB|nr:cupin domain-containing protein [Thioclava atlantica]KFE34519.1 DNA-binding transcriptional repressor [Thioclava atlantica]